MDWGEFVHFYEFHRFTGLTRGLRVKFISRFYEAVRLARLVIAQGAERNRDRAREKER